MIAPDEALRLILGRVRPLKSARKPLEEALGYCLAQDVRADRDMPPADRSAMDGFAARASDLSACPCVLHLVGEVAAGSPSRPRIRPGTCARVLTGANVPPGADTVVMVEQTDETDGVVTFRTSEKRGANIRRRGEEAEKGAVLLGRGTVLGPLQIGLCAAVGQAEVKVHRRPSVAVLCTGEELREVGARVRPHELRNSNGPALCAALENCGYGEAAHQVVPDDVKLLAARLRRAAAGHDVILLTGGVSVGKYDFVPEAVGRVGATIRFHGVAMKPGKPLLYATLPGNRHIFGLPGNPLSVMVGFYEFAIAALRRLSGLGEAQCRPAMRLPSSRSVGGKDDRVDFVLARLSWDQGVPSLTPVKSQGSADLAAGGQGDGVIVVPAGVRKLPAGAMVEFRPWGPLP